MRDDETLERAARQAARAERGHAADLRRGRPRHAGSRPARRAVVPAGSGLLERALGGDASGRGADPACRALRHHPRIHRRRNDVRADGRRPGLARDRLDQALEAGSVERRCKPAPGRRCAATWSCSTRTSATSPTPRTRAADHGRRGAAADVAGRVLRRSWSSGVSGHPVRPPRHRPVHEDARQKGRRLGVPAGAAPRDGPPQRGALHAGRHGRRREGSARPPRHRARARRRRIDGRHDRAGAGGQPSRPAGVAGADHVQFEPAAIGGAAVAGHQAGVRRTHEGRAVGGAAGRRGAQHLDHQRPQLLTAG